MIEREGTLRKFLVLFIVLCLLLLAACNSDSSVSKSKDSDSKDTSAKEQSVAEILKKTEEAHKDLESLEVEFMESYEGGQDKGVEKYDYKNSVGFLKYNEGVVMYKDKDGFLLSLDGKTEAPQIEEKNVFAMKFDNQMSQHKNQIHYLKEFDSDLYEKFDMEDKDEHFILTYSGSDKDKLQLMQGFADTYNENLADVLGRDVEAKDLTVDKLTITVEINKDTNQIETFEEEMKYSQFVDGKNRDYDQKVVYEYSNYNDIDEIKKPDFTGDKTTKEKDKSHALSKKDEKKYEEEASAYVDALIQATVFQNVDKYMEKAPDSKEDKKSDGQMQKNLFKDFYIQNTKQNMQGSSVSDKQINDLADAFLGALSKTKYEIVDVTVQTERDIAVTVSVEGIDDASIYQEAGQELKELYENEEIGKEELDAKNIEILIQKYNEVEALTEPKIVEVDVTRNQDSYEVLMQDQYLAGFVQ